MENLQYRETFESYARFFKDVSYTKGYEIAREYAERVSNLEEDEAKEATEIFALASLALWLGNREAADKLIEKLEKTR